MATSAINFKSFCPGDATKQVINVTLVFAKTNFLSACFVSLTATTIAERGSFLRKGVRCQNRGRVIIVN